MSQVINQHALPTAVRALYEPIKDHLEAAEEVLRLELQNESPFVNELLQYGGQLGGKRLRPALLLLTATATGNVSPDHYVLAIAEPGEPENGGLKSV